MKLKTLIIILIVFLMSMTLFSQSDLKNAPYTLYLSKDKTEKFLISTKPVTNREYIVYLIWLYNVYVDYPENFIESLPGIDGVNYDSMIYDWDYKNISLFESYFNYSVPFVKNYMFNPKYIDYPVIGLSWLQASKYCKWLSDRYNELTLIRHGYLKPNSDQLNEDCFVTESYLVDQYYGLRIKKEIINWDDRLLIPNFRLPTKKEFTIGNKEKLFMRDFRSYDFDSSNILFLWCSWYIKVNDSSLTINKYYESSEVIITSNIDWKIENNKYEELTLDINWKSKNANLIEIYNQNGQTTMNFKNNIFEKDSLGIIILNNDQIDYVEEKDSIGQMPFIIIDENTKMEPIIVDCYNKSNSIHLNPSKLYFFRFACSMKPKQYVP